MYKTKNELNFDSFHASSSGNSVSANASPAASSLNAISSESSESNYPHTKKFSLPHNHLDDTNSLNQSSIQNSLSTSSVPNTQHLHHHSSITSNISQAKITTNGDQSSHNKVNSNSSEKHDEQPKQSTSQQKQQKSSRRTTSLLNLFMSNSQGKFHMQTHTDWSPIQRNRHIHTFVTSNEILFEQLLFRFWPLVLIFDCFFFVIVFVVMKLKRNFGNFHEFGQLECQSITLIGHLNLPELRSISIRVFLPLFFEWFESQILCDLVNVFPVFDAW